METTLAGHLEESTYQYFTEKLFYEYNQLLKKIIIKFETNEHEAMGIIFDKLVDAIKESNFAPPGWRDELVLKGSPSK